MQLCDSHAHLTDLTWDNLQMMYLCGVTTVVSPVNFASVGPVTSSTIKDVWDLQLNFQLNRARQNLVNSYAMIGISMVSIPKDPDNLLKALPEYLKRERVVAIGEIGFEPSSKTCNDPKVQEYVVASQIEIAASLDVPIVFHTPNPPDIKIESTRKLLRMCTDLGLPMSKTLIDHSSGDNIEIVLESGALVGITVQPWRNLSPEIAADLVLKYGPERIVINSDCGTRLSDPIAVAKTAYALKRKGASDDVIRMVCADNGKTFYGI